MNRRNLTLLICATFTVIFAAVFYLGFERESAGGVQLEGSSESSNSNAHGRIVRKDENPASPAKSSESASRIDPSKYTAAPKDGTIPAKILKIFMDRQLADSEKVQRLLALVPHVDEQEKFMAMDRATQLIPDEEYVKLRPKLLQLAASERLRELVMLDMLTRDDGIKMTSLVELLRLPSATTRTEAREILEAFLEKDYGEDPQQWTAPVQEWLAQNQEF